MFSPLQYCNKASFTYVHMQMTENFWVKGIYTLNCHRCNVTEPYCSPKRPEQLILPAVISGSAYFFTLSLTFSSVPIRRVQIRCLVFVFPRFLPVQMFISPFIFLLWGVAWSYPFAYFSSYWVVISQICRNNVFIIFLSSSLLLVLIFLIF